MLWLEIIVVLGAIFFGARLGSIGIGYAGGLGVLILTLGMGLKLGAMPIDVILIIMSVIAAIAAMQVAGGLDYMVSIAERILRRNPKQITFLAPVVTYVMTFLAGTGHTAFATLPVIAEVAKEQGIRPSRPLSIAVVASQIAITASPISAAAVRAGEQVGGRQVRAHAGRDSLLSRGQMQRPAHQRRRGRGLLAPGRHAALAGDFGRILEGADAHHGAVER